MHIMNMLHTNTIAQFRFSGFFSDTYYLINCFFRNKKYIFAQEVINNTASGNNFMFFNVLTKVKGGTF